MWFIKYKRTTIFMQLFFINFVPCWLQSDIEKLLIVCASVSSSVRQGCSTRWLLWSHFSNSVNFAYAHSLPFIGLLICFFSDLLWFVPHMEILHAWCFCLALFYLGIWEDTRLAKWIHLFSIEPVLLIAFLTCHPLEGFLPPLKMLFSQPGG